MVTVLCRLEHAPNADLMMAFSREATNKLREFAPQNISNMLWAYATLGHSPGTLHHLNHCFCCGLPSHAETALLLLLMTDLKPDALQQV